MPDFEFSPNSPTVSAKSTASQSSQAMGKEGAETFIDSNRGVRPQPISTVSNQTRGKDDPNALLAFDEAAPLKSLQDLVHHLNRKQLKVRELMGSLSFALRSFNNINQILELIPLVTSRLIDADGAAVVVFEPGNQKKVVRLFCTYSSGDCSGLRTGLMGGEASLPLNSKKQSSTSTGEGTSEDEWSLDDSGSEALAITQLDDRVQQLLGGEVKVFAIPLLSRQVMRGRLYVFSSQVDFTWTEDRQALTRLVADQTAVAIENNDLTMELEQRAKLAQEIAVGSEIQMRLQPARCPDIAGLDIAAQSDSASPVGGDYYDFISIPYSPCDGSGVADYSLAGGMREQQSWAIAIGDVMGKGVPAGLLMMATRGVLRAEVLHAREPGDILQHLNHVIFSDMDTSNRFVTLFYSDYCPITRTLRFSNAAHNPCLWWQATTGQVQKLDTDGMLIGLEQGSVYGQNSVQLGVGDVVIYYTDGVTEAANSSGDRFEEEGLIGALRMAAEQGESSQEILDSIFAQVQAFRLKDGEGGAVDDMTAIVLKVSADKG